MEPIRQLVRVVQDPEETAALAARLAPLLDAGDTILLTGDIGAGKTAFARALVQARLAASGLHEEVPSPTFTLVQSYFDGATEIIHADLYRLGDAQEAIELGFPELFDTALCIVEWPEILGGNRPDPARTVAIGFTVTGETQRRLDVSAPSRLAVAFSAPAG